MYCKCLFGSHQASLLSLSHEVLKPLSRLCACVCVGDIKWISRARFTRRLNGNCLAKCPGWELQILRSTSFSATPQNIIQQSRLLDTPWWRGACRVVVCGRVSPPCCGVWACITTVLWSVGVHHHRVVEWGRTSPPCCGVRAHITTLLWSVVKKLLLLCCRWIVTQDFIIERSDVRQQQCYAEILQWKDDTVLWNTVVKRWHYIMEYCSRNQTNVSCYCRSAKNRRSVSVCKV